MPSFMGLAYILPIDVESVRLRYFSDTMSLHRNIVESDAQRWRMRLSLRPTADAQGAAVLAHKDEYGISRVFEVETPQPLGISVPKVTLNLGARVRGNDSLLVHASRVVKLMRGMFIKFPNDDKVYKVAADVDLTNQASRAVRVFPKLRKSADPAPNVELGGEVMMRVRHAPDGLFNHTYSNGVLTRAVIDVEEALSA